MSPNVQKKKQKENEQKQENNSQLVLLREDEIDPQQRKKKEQIEEIEENRRQERDLKLKVLLEEEERVRKKKEEEEEKHRTYKETKKALKNRQFTYDYNGKIVLVKALRSENLPEDVPVPSPEVNLNNPVVVEKIAYEKMGIKIPEYRKLEPTVASEIDDLSNIVDPKQQQQGRNNQRPQTAGKQRIILQKSSQNQIKRPQSGVENTQQHKRLSSATSNRQGSNDQNNANKLLRQQSIQKFGGKKSEFGDAFFPKQVQIYDLLNPANGVGIRFANGIRKTGGDIIKPNRMKKADYEKMIENQPKLSYIEEHQQCIENENKSFKDKLNDKEIQEHMDELKKSQNALTLKNKLAVRIVEEDQYIKMLSTQICSNNPRQLIQQKLSQSRISSKASIVTKKPGKKVQTFERITAYPKQNILTELPLINVQDKLKPTKAQKLINQFNEKEILKNPNWGEKNYPLEQSSISSKDGLYNNATNFRQRRELCTTQHRPASSKFRSSSFGSATARPKSAVKYQQIIEQKESLIESKLGNLQD